MSVEPLVLFNARFFGAGILLLMFVHLIRRERVPRMGEWRQLGFFGLFNTTLYLGLFVLALDEVTPGITTLAVALNPLFIAILSALWMRRAVHVREWVGIVVGIAGVVVAAWPHLETSYASALGLVLIGLSQIAYSVGAVYYADVKWTLSRTAINGWQACFGAWLTLPFTFLLHGEENHFDQRFFLSLSWLVIPVSIGAIQLWLRLLKEDAVRASMWLYLCPVFGFLYAWWLMGEPLSVYTLVGTVLVLGALWMGGGKLRMTNNE